MFWIKNKTKRVLASRIIRVKHSLIKVEVVLKNFMKMKLKLITSIPKHQQPSYHNPNLSPLLPTTTLSFPLYYPNTIKDSLILVTMKDDDDFELWNNEWLWAMKSLNFEMKMMIGDKLRQVVAKREKVYHHIKCLEWIGNLIDFSGEYILLNIKQIWEFIKEFYYSPLANLFYYQQF